MRADGKAAAEKRRIKIAKFLDSILGFLLIQAYALKLRLRPRRRSANPRRGHSLRVQKILFIKLWGMGSVTLSEPALRWLRNAYPQAALHYLTLDRNKGLFALIPDVSKVHVLSFESLWRLGFQTWGLIRTLRSENYDLVFDGEFLVNYSGLVARAAKGRVIGFSGPFSLKKRIQDESVTLAGGLHASAQFLRLAAGQNRALATAKPSLTVPVQSVDRRLTDSKGKSFYPFRRTYVALNVNASQLATERRWPRERFVEMARALSDAYRFDWVLIGSASEKPYVDLVERDLGIAANVWNFCGCLDIPGLALLLSRARLLISNDSGPVHLASALDTPVVAFYGPETPVRYGPLNSRALVFYENLLCSPCMNPENGKSVKCIHSLRCMTSIEAPRVIEGIGKFVDDHGLLRPWRIEEDRKKRTRGEACG